MALVSHLRCGLSRRCVLTGTTGAEQDLWQEVHLQVCTAGALQVWDDLCRSVQKSLSVAPFKAVSRRVTLLLLVISIRTYLEPNLGRLRSLGLCALTILMQMYEVTTWQRPGRCWDQNTMRTCQRWTGTTCLPDPQPWFLVASTAAPGTAAPGPPRGFLVSSCLLRRCVARRCGRRHKRRRRCSLVL